MRSLDPASMDPRYTPPALSGWVFWSHYLRDDAARLIPMNAVGREYCAQEAAAGFGVPVDAIRVESFTPSDGYAIPQWTVYVRDDYRSLVEERNRDLFEKLRMLRQMHGMDRRPA